MSRTYVLAHILHTNHRGGFKQTWIFNFLGEEALLKNLHPYHKKMASKKFKLDPYHGFVPIMEEEAPAAVSERKKRDVMDMSMEKSQDLTLPPHPYNFHPFLGLGGGKPEDSENTLYKYVPYYGFVPAEGKTNEEDLEAEGEDGGKILTFFCFLFLDGA